MPQVTENIATTGETPEARFVRIGERRVSNILKQIELIGNLATGSYKYDQAQVDKLFSAVDKTLERTRAAFTTALAKRNGAGSHKPDFKF